MTPIRPPNHFPVPLYRETGPVFLPQPEPPLMVPAVEGPFMIPPTFQAPPMGIGFLPPGPGHQDIRLAHFPHHPPAFAPLPSFPPVPHAQPFPPKFGPQFQPISLPISSPPEGFFAIPPSHPHVASVPHFSPPPPQHPPAYHAAATSPVSGPSMPAPTGSASPQAHQSSPVSSSHSGFSGQSGGQHNRKQSSSKNAPRTKILPRSSMGPATQLLHAFRTTQDRTWTVRDLEGHIPEFSGDQYGSRFVQDAITEGDSATVDLVYNEIVESSILKTSKDVFGNYVVQRILEHGTDAHKDGTLKHLQGHMRDLSLHIYGCRVVQKLLDVATSTQQGEIVKELEPHIPECVQSAHGNHVVQKILEVVPPTYLNFVNIFRGRVIEFARHTYGCRVIQRCLQHLPPLQAQPLLTEFMKRAFDMITDQFGNYVIQYLLESGGMAERGYIVSLMRGHIVRFSLHKHASNVCEKALIYTSEMVRQDLIDELLVLDRHHFPLGVYTLVHDQYGNYVLQRAVEQARGRQKAYLMSIVSQQLRHVKIGPSGDHWIKYIAVDRALKRNGVDAYACAPVPANPFIDAQQPLLAVC